MDSTLPAITWNTKTYLPLEPEALFHYLADFTSTRNWDPSVTDGLLLPESRLLPNGPIDVGSQFELQFKIGWSISQFDYKIIEYAPPHQLTLISEGRGYTIYDHIQISPDLVNPAHSVLEYKLTFHYKNPHFFAIWLGKRAIRYFAAKAIKNLKRIPLAHSGRIKLSSPMLSKTILPVLFHFTRFGFYHTKKSAQPLPINRSGLKVVLTGSTSGIGREIAIELSRVGVELIMINRTETKASQFAKQLQERFQNKVHSYIADFSHIHDTMLISRRIRDDFPSIDVLINNAGELINERQITEERFERNFAVLLLAPYVITKTLLPSLEFQRQPNSNQPPAKVINMCSGGLYTQGVHLDDLQYKEGTFNGAKAYARAKRGLLDITEQFARLYDKHTVVFHAMHPGWVNTPGVENALATFFKITKPILRTPYQGADTAIWLALSQASDHLSGLFWLDRKIQSTSIFPNTKTHPSQQSELFARLDLLMKKMAKANLNFIAPPVQKEA